MPSIDARWLPLNGSSLIFGFFRAGSSNSPVPDMATSVVAMLAVRVVCEAMVMLM
jgi:hypothetical protein